MNPGSKLFADRFRLLQTLSERGGLGLHLVRDLASEDELWLLRLAGPSLVALEELVRYRLRRFAGYLPFRSYEIRGSIRLSDELFLTILPRAHERFVTSRAQESQLSVGLAKLATAGFVGGGLCAEDLRVDERGPFFLPTAYAAPPAFDEQAWIPFTRSPRACRAELESIAGELGIAFEDATLRSEPEAAFAWSDWIRTSIAGPAGVELRGDRAAAMNELDAVARACAESGRDLLVMGPYWR